MPTKGYHRPRTETESPQPDPTPAPDDVDITREEPQRQKVDAIHAWELSYGCLGGDPGYLLTGREAVAVNVKMYDGSVAYHTAVSLPEGILTGGNATSRNLQTILDRDCYPVARLACFCDNAYAAAMGGVDASVFTAGVGENAPSTRAHILEGLEFMGITCDEEKNNTRGEERIISKEGAPVTVMVIPTNEELMIAQDTLSIVEENKNK